MRCDRGGTGGGRLRKQGVGAISLCNLTAAQSIKAECRSCKGGGRWDCESKVCYLNKPGLSALKRIKLHCVECCGGVKAEVADCTGRLLRENGNGKHCWLHPFRLGKNPYREKSPGRPENFAQNRREKGISKTPESTILGGGEATFPIPGPESS